MNQPRKDMLLYLTLQIDKALAEYIAADDNELPIEIFELTKAIRKVIEKDQPS